MPKTYNCEKLTLELLDAGLNICGCNELGDIWWNTEPMESELTDAQAILDAHDPTPQASPLEKYKSARITPDEMLSALWESAVNGNTQNMTALETRIKQ